MSPFGFAGGEMIRSCCVLLVTTWLLLLLPACGSDPVDPGVADVDAGEPDRPISQPDENAAPVAEWGNAPISALEDMHVPLSIEASDPDGDELTIAWSADIGEASGSGTELTYVAPPEAGLDTVTVIVRDSSGQEVQLTHQIAIFEALEFSPPETVVITPGNAKSPVIATLENGETHIVWHDFSTDPPGLNHASGSSGDWQWTALTLSPEKSIFADLVTDGESLHLLWQSDLPDTTIMYAAWDGIGWSTASQVGPGERVAGAIDENGMLHAVYYTDGRPAHSVLDNGTWRAGSAISIDHTYINTFGMALVPAPDGLDLAVATSPGETRYDVRLFSWTESLEWTPMRTIYTSLGLSSDEPAGAMGVERPHWVWTEQSADDPFTIGIVEQTEIDSEPRWVTTESGFSQSPSITIPADGKPIVAWMTPEDTIAISRMPYDLRHHFTSENAAWPELTTDRDGYSHLVYYARDSDGIQQVYYSTNRQQE